MIQKNRGNTTVHAGLLTSGVDILHARVVKISEEKERVILYGMAENDMLGQSVGFTLTCIIHWRNHDYSFDDQDELARDYFSNLISRHVRANTLLSDAEVEMVFTDPELGERIGDGSGFLKFQGGFLN